MKKYLIVFILFFISAIISCKKDPLDITPDGRLSLDQTFSDEILTGAYLNSIYTKIPSYFNFYFFFTFLSGLSDESHDADDAQGLMSSQWYSGSLTSDNNPIDNGGSGGKGSNYNQCWAAIRQANIFLANVDKSPISDPKEKARNKAEAHLLRAFFYLELIKEYGGMPIETTAYPVGYDYSGLTRSSFDDCAKFVASDCDTAIAEANLPLRITSEREHFRFSKAVAYIIKSEVLLYNASPLWNTASATEKWQSAADASKTALTALTDGGNYALFPDYSNYFLNGADISPSPSDRETIFETKEYQAAGGGYMIIQGITRNNGGYKAGDCPSQEMVDAYDMQSTGLPAILGYSDDDHLKPVINTASGYDPANPYTGRDPRFYATIWANGEDYPGVGPVEAFVGGADGISGDRSHTRTGYYLRKFFDPNLKASLGQAGNARWKKYRLAELYLNYAEAENEANGPLSGVYDAINTIRRRAKMPDLPAGLNQDQMRERIRNERRVELAIEEHRFWDVRRWKILGQTDKLVTGMKITAGGASLKYDRIVVGRRPTFTDKYLIFPIPIGDISKIPTLGQNPGW